MNILVKTLGTCGLVIGIGLSIAAGSPLLFPITAAMAIPVVWLA